MNLSWKVCWLWCFYDSFIGVVIAGDQESMGLEAMEVITPSVSHPKSITDIPTKKKSILDLKNSYILRDTKTHNSPDTSKSALAEILKNIPPMIYESSTDYETLDQNIFNQTRNDNSTVERSDSKISNISLRNTRDLISDLSLPPTSTEIEISNIPSNPFKQNNFTSSPNATEKDKSADEFLASLPNSSTSYELLKTTPQIAIVQTTSSTVTLKNPKDKENKTKSETSPKQLKKISINMKNKTSSFSNVNTTNDNIKAGNVTDYSHDIINDSFPNVTSINISSLRSRMNEEKVNNNISTSSLQTVPDNDGLQPFDIALITIAVVAIISTVTAIGLFSVMIYRRYHWNKPQTFSDKCSNADSTGYIDDSTLKENSEEMYSLDNDSFLNSLEAMTIQNYWADSIRHTKL